MTFTKFQKSWWGWAVYMTFALGIAYMRRFDTFSLIVVGVFVSTGTLRLFSKQLQEFAMKGMAQALAKMSAEERDKKLQELSPEQRGQVARELENIAASHPAE